MYRLVSHLDKLLALHDCVIIPSLGAIIKEYVPARYSDAEYMVYPMEECFHFNGELRERDGLLDDLYAKSYHVSMRRARNLVDTDVEELRREMIRLGGISIGHVGRLMIGADGKMDFQPEHNRLPLGYGEAYGLSTYTLPRTLEKALTSIVVEAQNPLTEDTEATPEKSDILQQKSDTKYLHFRVSRRVVGWAAAAAVFLVCLLPVTTHPVQEYFSASFVPTETQQTSIFPGEKTLQQGKIATETTCEMEKSQAESEELLPSSLGDYYVIIGSFRTEAKVNEFLGTHRDSAFATTMGAVKKGKNRLIYAKRFTSSDEAESYLATLRKSGKEYSEAWLLHYSE